MAASAFDLEPMSIGDILDRTVRLYRQAFLHNLGIVAIPYIVLIPVGAVAASAVWLRGDSRGMLSPGILAGAILVGLAFIWLNFMSMGALARSVSERFLGRTPGVWASYQAVLRRTLSLFWAYALAFLAWGGVGIVGAILVGAAWAVAGWLAAAIILLAVILGAIVAFFRFLLVTQVIVIESVRGIAALQRSWVLMGQNFWRALLVLLFFVAVAFLLSIALNVPGAFLRALVPPPGGQVLAQIVGQLAQILLMPFGSIAFTLLYYDSRIRKEAFDLEMMAQNLGIGRAPSAPGPPPGATSGPRPSPPSPPEATPTPPASPPAAAPRRPIGPFKVCPQCGAQVPLARPSCPACGAAVPFRSSGG